MSEYRVSMQSRPIRLNSGDIAFALPQSMVEKNDEIALGVKFVCNRTLFGQCFRSLMPAYFDSMKSGSGVMIQMFVPSENLLSNMKFPGDIDLLIIPYEDNDLVISNTLAVELKAVRATFKKQGKSPNQFGFSQAKALLDWGFPYVAVGHLIVSDRSPPDSWRKVLITRVVDAAAGTVQRPWEVAKDMMPSDLIRRCFGRLETQCQVQACGLFASYLASAGVWFPHVREATRNPKMSEKTMEALANYYHANAAGFLDTPKY